MVQSISTSHYLIWSDLVAITGVSLARNIFSKSLEQASIFSKFQANENIRGAFPLLVTVNFCKIVLLKLFK